MTIVRVMSVETPSAPAACGGDCCAAETEKSQNPPLTPALEAAAEQNFASFYLRQTTQEFADDLDKLRTASDFNDRSVELLVDSLQKGTACFSKQDRIRVGRVGVEK